MNFANKLIKCGLDSKVHVFMNCFRAFVTKHALIVHGLGLVLHLVLEVQLIQIT